MRIRPVHTWWLGAALFAPSVLIWASVFAMSIYWRKFNCPFNWYGIRFVYLPLFAASLGLAIPLVNLRLLRTASWRLTMWAFGAYVAVFLAWAVIDVRYENHQNGGHDYPNGPIVDGHRYYWHSYFTWYFIPYRWIERGM